MTKIDIEYSSFTKFLIENKENNFNIINLPGNHGDELIHRGLYKKAGELGINFSVTNINKNSLYYLKRFFYRRFKITTCISVRSNCDIVLLHGGGYFSDLGGFCEGCRLLEAISCHCDKPIVVAPQTFYFRDFDFSKFLTNITNDFFLFCRERESFKLLKKMEMSENVTLFVSHDTAFYLNKSDFIEKKGGYDLFSFRKGSEAKLPLSEKKELINHLRDNNRKVCNIDASICGTYQDFVGVVEGADRIFTDRLHVAILSSIIGKKCLLFPNIYFKNNAVYKYSLRGYPKTFFFESVDDCIKAI